MWRKPFWIVASGWMYPPGLELEMALGLKTEKIVFSGPGKTHKELTLAVGNPQ